MNHRLTAAALATIMTFGQATAQELQGRTFVYGEEVRLPQSIRFNPDDKRPVEQILDEALRDTGIGYRVTARHILLYRLAEARPSATTQHNIHGYVTDATSGETLIGANVYCPALGTGTVTNAYGFYSLPMPVGQHALLISYVGYESQVVTLQVMADVTENVALAPAHQLHEIIVESDRPETGAASTRMSATTLTMQQIQQMPSMLGEADVIKSLHVLPGVQTGFAGTSQMSVRGGNLDQNLFLLDGVLLYNVHHVLGFESAFMPDAVKHVDFFRGSFPARYGGRLSSVCDVRTKDGDLQRLHGLFSIGLLSSHLALEGPLVKNRTSFIVSGRRSYAGWLMRAMMASDAMDGDEIERFDLYFYDVNAKVNHRFSDTDRLFLSFYRGQDGLTMGVKFSDTDSYNKSQSTSHFDQDVRWGNTFSCLRWNHLYTPSLFSNLTLGYNRYAMLAANETRYTEREQGALASDDRFKTDFRSGIDDMMLIYDFDWHPVQSHHIRMGGSYTLHLFRPEVQSAVQSMTDGNRHIEQRNDTGKRDTRGHEVALYAEDDIDLGGRWQLNAGLRAVAFGVDGRCYPAAEPRLSASYRLADGLRAKAAYTLMHQYVHQLTTSPVNMPTDLWVSVTKDFRPMTANQWTIGLACNRWAGWELSAEAYWKEMRHVLEYADGASFYGSSRGWESKVTQGEGRGMGLELAASRTVGKTTGNVSYTLSKADRRFPDGSINNGCRYPYEYDRRHVVHIVVQQQFTPHVDFNVSWNYSSGGYVSLAKQQSIYILPESNTGSAPTTYGEDYYSGRNNYHLKPRHQLDLSLNVHHTTRHGERIWNFSLINAYLHKNQDFAWTVVKYESQPVVDPETGRVSYVETASRKVIKQVTIIPILPSVSYTYRF